MPLLVLETRSEEMRALYEEDSILITWAWTRVEIVSAIERRVRDESMSRDQRRKILDALGSLAESWDEVVDVAAVRSRALAVLARQTLRAADAGQLGAALLVADDRPDSLDFVCLDDRLGLAAEREGFRVLPG